MAGELEVLLNFLELESDDLEEGITKTEKKSLRTVSPENCNSSTLSSSTTCTSGNRNRLNKSCGKENATATANVITTGRNVAQDKLLKSQLVSSAKKDDRRILRDLDYEKTRRWKAEQASIKLADNVRLLKLQAEQSQQKYELIVVQASKLEQLLIKERGEHAKVKEERDQLRVKFTDVEKECEKLNRKYEGQNCHMNELEGQLERLEKERVQCHHKLRDAEIQAATNERESSLKEQITNRLQQQIHDLQELLAIREREHMKEVTRLTPSEGKLCNIKVAAEKEIEKEKLKAECVIVQYKERLENQTKKYRDLEEEFRAALRIEASRYEQLNRSHESVLKELSTCKESLEAMKEKEDKSSSLVVELTTIVKEQKGRIIQLQADKQDLVRDLKDKVKGLQNESRVRAKLEEQVSSVLKENSQLSSKLMGHESIISGLREERKLWGQELALQGASLAQDRGKMESQIESLNQEILGLRKQLEHCTSSLKVKDKVIEDESQTIKSLKEQINSQNIEISSLKNDNSIKLNAVQEKYEQVCHDLQEQIEVVTEDKMAIDNELRDVQEKEASWKEKYKSLKAQWEERLSVIASLEEGVHQLQKKAKERQLSLEQERDLAIEETKHCKQQMALLDGKYKEQLIAQETVLRNRMTELTTSKESEMLVMKEKMEEMENSRLKERKVMEEKFLKMSKAFHELQKDYMT